MHAPRYSSTPTTLQGSMDNTLRSIEEARLCRTPPDSAGPRTSPSSHSPSPHPSKPPQARTPL
eukprot:4307197-Pleurochrysis_carterae.AAC.1